MLGSIVISTYVQCEDVRLVITPDLKGPRRKNDIKDATYLLFVDLSGGQRRLGGSALAQCYGQLGNDAPDLNDPSMLKKAFNSIQKLIKSKRSINLIRLFKTSNLMKTIFSGQKLLSGHDISDGGFITCLLEMAFGGYCGLHVDLNKIEHVSCVNNIEILFSEECGWILEVDAKYIAEVLLGINVPAYVIGRTTTYGNESRVNILFFTFIVILFILIFNTRNYYFIDCNRKFRRNYT